MILFNIFTIFALTSRGVFPSKECASTQHVHKFFKIRDCFKSTLPVIASRSNIPDVETCVKFTRQRKGLAFNYSPPEILDVSDDPYVQNCQVLGCPEIGKNSPTLILDPLFNYYSSYGNLSENASCIKSLGLFSIDSEKRNYSEAIMNCQRLGGDLADVSQEQRNHLLSNRLQFLQGWYKAAYVGLDDTEVEGDFKNPLGKLLKCTKYRAWSPGHPRKGRKYDDCVILDSKSVWRAINCKIKLPSICEIYPNRPERTPIIIKSVDCTEIHNKQKKKKCIENNKLFEVYNSSSRLDQCALLSDFDD